MNDRDTKRILQLIDPTCPGIVADCMVRSIKAAPKLNLLVDDDDSHFRVRGSSRKLFKSQKSPTTSFRKRALSFTDPADMRFDYRAA